MVKMGIAVGCPKVYFKSGEMLHLGKWDEKLETELNKRETASNNNNWSLMPYARDSSQPLFTIEDTDIPMTKWLRYSFGSTFGHPRLVSPKALSWSYSKYSSCPNNGELARLFHELVVFLPINGLDEIMDRLNTVKVEFTKKFNAETFGVSEVTLKVLCCCQDW